MYWDFVNARYTNVKSEINNTPNVHNTNPQNLQHIKDQGLSTDGKPHFHLSAEMKYHLASLGVMCGQHVNPPTSDYLDEGYRWK